jgi:hypothetical protein
MTLNELAQQIHANAGAKGFWEEKPCPNRFCDHTTARHPAEVLLLIGSEVTEAYEAVRDGYALNDDATDWISGPNMRSHQTTRLPDGTIWVTHLDGGPVLPPLQLTDDMRRTLGFEPKPVGVPSELADIIIRALDAAAGWGIDLDAAVARKMAYNTARARLHGRQA